MKRIVALLLATLMLAFSLTACADTTTRSYRTETTTRDNTQAPRTTTEVERRNGYVYDNDGIIDDLERGNDRTYGTGAVVTP